ncbi:MAG: PEP-CTERM sorting domain-containing protein [Verrucomicrobiaceae bacterium]
MKLQSFAFIVLFLNNSYGALVNFNIIAKASRIINGNSLNVGDEFSIDILYSPDIGYVSSSESSSQFYEFPTSSKLQLGDQMVALPQVQIFADEPFGVFTSRVFFTAGTRLRDDVPFSSVSLEFLSEGFLLWDDISEVPSSLDDWPLNLGDARISVRNNSLEGGVDDDLIFESTEIQSLSMTIIPEPETALLSLLGFTAIVKRRRKST